ncbi:hypothetical protein HPB47_027417 [Ixodes persulcatus]|uniref:Uncharacterized protein n=1 Tax=Ixodes persulcatus TaxID=34615 RepID=A0AC60PVV9_IXOPE|nr:hypothetical protein HPB47_027417 [Ixodes persulcatus]
MGVAPRAGETLSLEPSVSSENSSARDRVITCWRAQREQYGERRKVSSGSGHTPLIPVVIVGCLLPLPLWIALAQRNNVSKNVLRVGWAPILLALIVSSFGGFILDYSVMRFPGIALHLSSVNALGGNLAAIFSCSLSSYLFRVSQLGVLPAGERTCTGPVQMFLPRGEMSNVAIVLLVVVLPGQTLFAVLSKVLRFGYISMSLAFLLAYLAASLAQVAVLLYLCRLLVYALWRCRVDPDNAAIPFLAGTGDFLGTGLLTLAFFALEVLGDPGAHDEAAFDRPPMDGPRWGSMTKTTVAVRVDSKKPRLGPNTTFSGPGRQP